MPGEGFFFGCTACGKCCNSAPRMSLPELFHHQSRFAGCLSIRRVPRLREGQRLHDGTLVDRDAASAASELAGRLFHDAGPCDIDLYAQAFSYASLARCPALAADGACAVHHDRKPTVCAVVPLEAAWPDSLQHAVLGSRRKESQYLGADCIREAHGPALRQLTRRLAVVDAGSRDVLEQHRGELAREREYWGRRVFRLLGPELFEHAERVRALPEPGAFTLSLVPVLSVLAEASEPCRARWVKGRVAWRRMSWASWPASSVGWACKAHGA